MSQKDRRGQIDAIVDRLELDYIDLIYIHRWEDETPIEQIMWTLDGSVDSSRVNHLLGSMLWPNA